ncbi:endo-1,4-beta-xylanase [Caulobacter radicis]|nr:endo-1,4-beta-xylanase [Caulobacter radicis]
MLNRLPASLYTTWPASASERQGADQLSMVATRAPQSSAGPLSRRGVLACAAALTATPGWAQEQIALKKAAFPIGACVQALHLDDQALVDLLQRQVSQITAEWQMNMEYVIGPDGGFQFDAPDRIAAFAQANAMRLFGHTLVWYAQAHPAFETLDETRIGFGDAYRNYILAVVGRYRGRMSGWNVVNEPVTEMGDGLRESLWSRRLGQLEHMSLAFNTAREADPTAALFINDYNLEYFPAKRATFLRLAERLLASGAPLTGLGTQMHLAADLPRGSVSEMMRDLASLGLPIHVSELDISLVRADNKALGRQELQRRQSALYGEVAEAFARLRPNQRFAFTFWGLRDRDSWLRKENATDTPSPFDDLGRAKPGAVAIAGVFGI